MLFGETVAVYCENHTEHTDTLCGQSVSVLKQVVRVVTTVPLIVRLQYPEWDVLLAVRFAEHQGGYRCVLFS
jgi:hypothetical protein